MSTNNNEDKSKIDKIREDLEKKLAALERTKQGDEREEIPSEEELQEDKPGDILETPAVEDIQEEVKSVENASFLDQISEIENKSATDDLPVDENEIEEVEDSNDAIFEISDEIEVIDEKNEVEDVEEDNNREVGPPIISNKSEKIDFDKIEKKEEPKNDNSFDAVAEEIEELEENDEEEKSSNKVNFLIYGLIGALLLGVGYFAMNYLKDKNRLDSDITSKKISELENRRYQDSIKLLEAEKRLAEFESQRYIDSIAEADRLKLSVAKVPEGSVADKTKKAKKKKPAKPTTTIYKNNKPVATSSSNVNFDKVVSSGSTTSSNTNQTDSQKDKTEGGNDLAISEGKDKEIVKEIKKEKKIETLNTIEQAPIYPGCEKQRTERAKKTCMISKINKFVNKNFNAYVAQDLGLESGRQKIYISFIIDKNGYVNVLRTRAKHEALKKEAVRVVNKLPRMKPAMNNGKKTQIVYNLPIVFSIE